jgi:hypothetical protein
LKPGAGIEEAKSGFGCFDNWVKSEEMVKRKVK